MQQVRMGVVGAGAIARAWHPAPPQPGRRAGPRAAAGGLRSGARPRPRRRPSGSASSAPSLASKSCWPTATSTRSRSPRRSGCTTSRASGARGRQARPLQQDDDHDGRRGDRADRAGRRREACRIVASPGEVLRPHVQRIKRADRRGRARAALLGGLRRGLRHATTRRRRSGSGDDVAPNIDPSWYFRKPGGGPLYDMTVYALHALTEHPRAGAARDRAVRRRGSRSASSAARCVPTDADDNTLMLLDFGDSLFALVYGTAAGAITEGFSPSLLRHRRRDRRAARSTASRSTTPGAS